MAKNKVLRSDPSLGISNGYISLRIGQSMPAGTNKNTYKIAQSLASNSRVFISSVGTGRTGWPVVLEELTRSVEE